MDPGTLALRPGRDDNLMIVFIEFIAGLVGGDKPLAIRIANALVDEGYVDGDYLKPRPERSSPLPQLLPSIDDGWPELVEGDYYRGIDGEFWELRNGCWARKI